MKYRSKNSLFIALWKSWAYSQYMDKSILREFQATSSSFFLFGPRGTGKSTWLKEKYPEAIYIDLLDDITYRKLLIRPESLNEIILGQNLKHIVIIDF